MKYLYDIGYPPLAKATEHEPKKGYILQDSLAWSLSSTSPTAIHTSLLHDTGPSQWGASQHFEIDDIQ